MTLKDMIRLMTPPVFIRLARWLVWSEGKPHFDWEYIAEGWAYTRKHPEIKGWNVVGVLETYKNK